jgi:Mn-dependent DtxR family transcriptional regulator
MSDKLYITINGKKREMNAEEIAQHEKDQAEAAAEQSRIESEMQAKQQTLDSAIAKLAKLGLTEDEAKAIIGLQ